MELMESKDFIISTSHALLVMENIQEHLYQKQLCDVTIIVGSQRFAAHRLVLSAVSDYFRAMFNNDVREAVEKEFAIHNIDSDIFLNLINYIYTGKLEINEENVEKMMSAANMLQLHNVVDAASKFLIEQLHPSNCLGIRSFADMQNSQKLYKAANEYTMDHFTNVVKNQEFLELSLELVCKLLASDDVNVETEEEIFCAMMQWIEHSKTNRAVHISELLTHVRLSQLSKEYLVDIVQSHSLVQSDLRCEHLVIDSLMYHLFPARRPTLSRPRPSTLGHLYTIGGMDNSKGATSIECYQRRHNRWSKVANMTSRRLQFGVAVIDSKLFVVGGRDGLKTLNSVECFNTRTMLWSSMPPVATHRHGLGVAVLRGPMYAVGGHDGWSYLSTVERWDPQSRVWNYVAPMSIARSTVGVAVLFDKLFAVGGRDGSSCLRSVECFDPHTNKWTNCAPMSKRRGGVGVGVCGGHLYAIGGHDAPASNQMSKLSETVERYDPKIDQWTTVASMSVPRDAVGISVLGGKLYACGGYNGQSYLSTCESYDPETNEWTSVAELNIGRAGAVVVYVKNRA